MQQTDGIEHAIEIALQGSSHGIEVAHVDCDLRYTFIYAHPDSSIANALGKRDDEIDLNDGTIRLRELKKRVINSGVPEQAIISLPIENNIHTYRVSVEPLLDERGNINGATCVSVDITDVKNIFTDKKSLKGILSLCSYCKDIRNDQGDWEQVDVYISKNTNAQISHGICPECFEKHYPNMS